MTIRKKTLLVVGLTLLGLLVTAFVVSRGILSQGFADLEETETQANVQRALSALSVESSDVDTLVKDWAEWDDTYAFIEDSNDEYIDSNLIDGMFISTPSTLFSMSTPPLISYGATRSTRRRRKKQPCPRTCLTTFRPVIG